MPRQGAGTHWLRARHSHSKVAEGKILMTCRALHVRFFTVTLLTLAPQFFTPALMGQTEPSAEKESAPDLSSIRPDLLTKLATPWSTLATFRRALSDVDHLDDAAPCLDLSKFDATTAAAKQGKWMFCLGEILSRLPFIWVPNVPDDPEPEVPMSLASMLRDQDGRLGEQFTSSELADLKKIVIARCPDGLWRFSGGTLAELDDIWTRWETKTELSGTASVLGKPISERLKNLFPIFLHQKRFLLQHYQWICLLALIIVGFATDIFVRFLLRQFTAAWTRLQGTDEDQQVERRLWKPIGLLSQALVWYEGTKAIGLPASALVVLLTGLKLFTLIASVWTGFLLVDLLSRRWLQRAATTESKFDDLLVPLISKSLKVFTFCVGIFAFAETFGVPITGLLGGLGLGGAALAFASKDTVANVFGSLTVLIDRPFEIGDSIVSSNVEGTVEKVGFRSTRVRTFYNSLMTVPNSTFTTAIVDNMGRREFRRIKVNLGLEYGTTPDQIEAFCEGIRELLRRNPYTRKDNFQVYFNQFSDSSLDVLLYFFLKCSEWSEELQQRHQLFLDITRLAERLGVSFAFPTRTLHVLNEEATDSKPADLGDPLEAGRKLAADISDSSEGEGAK